MACNILVLKLTTGILSDFLLSVTLLFDKTYVFFF